MSLHSVIIASQKAQVGVSDLSPLPFSQALGTFSGLSLNTAWSLDSAGRCVLEVVLLRYHEVRNLPEHS